MKSSDLNDSHIGGQFTATISGPITGYTEGPGYREVNVDPGLPGGSLVTLRLVDDDPIDVEATEGPERLNHNPDLTLGGLTQEEADALRPPAPTTTEPSSASAGDDPAGDLGDDEPTPEAGE